MLPTFTNARLANLSSLVPLDSFPFFLLSSSSYNYPCGFLNSSKSHKTTNWYHTIYAQILIEVDISKGLTLKICLATPFGTWTQCLDYEDIPFHCRKCHQTGHLATSCSSVKSSPLNSPSWWKYAKDDHYTVFKAPPVGDVDSSLVSQVAASPVSSPADSETSYVPPLPAAGVNVSSVGEETPGPSLTPVLVVHPSPIGGQLSHPVPAPTLDLSPGFVGDPVASGSLGMSFLVSSGHSVSLGDWFAEAAKVEDGWTTVKGKKSRPSFPPFDMHL